MLLYTCAQQEYGSDFHKNKRSPRSRYAMPLTPVLTIDHDIPMAVNAWRRAHRCRDGVEADYTCTFKSSQQTGGHKMLVFKAGVCIADVSAEQELKVRSDHFRRGLPFPARAYHRVCLQLAATEHSRRCKVKCVLASFDGDEMCTRLTRCRAVFTFPDIFVDKKLTHSKQLVLGAKAVHNVVHNNRGLPWVPLTAARTEGLVCSTGFFDHLATTTWPGLKYAGLRVCQDGPARNTFVRCAPMGRSTLEFDACWKFPQGHTATLSPQQLASLPPGEVRLLAENVRHHRAMPVSSADAHRADDAGEPSASDADSTDSGPPTRLALPRTRKRRRFVRPHFVFQETHHGPIDVY